MGKPSEDFLNMLIAAAPRLVFVAGVIGIATDWSHAGTFLVGVIFLYAWKVIKYHYKDGSIMP